jgi:hypothetical protein
MANVGSTLSAGQQLNQNDYLLTPSGNYQLILQDDSNLVVYQSPGSNQVPRWSSNTQGQDSQYAIMQTDGNFVIYDSSQPPNALWTTGTRGSPNCVLAIKDSEDTMSGYTLTIYDPSNHTTTFIE